MAIKIGDNIRYQGQKPLDDRVVKDTLAEILAMDSTIIYDGIIAFCRADGKYYCYNSANTVDASLGKWRNWVGATKTSELVNDSGFITNATNDLVNYYLKSETYTKQEVQNLISQITSVRLEVVNALPETGESNVIYLVPSAVSQTNDSYDEWVYINNTWEKIGTTQADLTNYYTKSEVNTLLTNKANQSDLTSHVNNTNVHVTTQEKSTWDGKSVVGANPTMVGTEANLTGIDINGVKYKVPQGGSGGSSVWGEITGTIGNQTDLQQEFATKEEKSVLLSQSAYDALVAQGAVVPNVTYYVYDDSSEVVVVDNEVVFPQGTATVSNTKATLTIGSVSGTKVIL